MTSEMGFEMNLELGIVPPLSSFNYLNHAFSKENKAACSVTGFISKWCQVPSETHFVARRFPRSDISTECATSVCQDEGNEYEKDKLWIVILA